MWIQEVINSYQSDSAATTLLQELAVVSPNPHRYSLTDGLTRFKNKIWVGNNSALHTNLIAAFHTFVLGGHSGIKATYQRVKKMFSWGGLKQDVNHMLSGFALSAS
jgi:hypothetical protein